MVKPGAIEAVRLRPKPAEARAEYAAKLAKIQSQADMFRAEYKELEFLDSDIILDWRCQEPCPECRGGCHSMKVLDWGLLELARRDGWPAAKAQLERISNLQTHDFRLFLGNFRLHLTSFGIIGLWYPKRRPQIDLL